MSTAIFRDRRLAAGVLAVVILVFTPLGARLSLRRAVDRVEAGLDVDEYVADSVNASRNLVTLGASLGIETETDVLRQALYAAEDWDSLTSITEKAHVNSDLAVSFENLRSAIASLELSERDAESLDIYTRAFDGPQTAIGRSGYNEAVDEFMEKTYNAFPANLLGSLLGVDPPEYFS